MKIAAMTKEEKIWAAAASAAALVGLFLRFFHITRNEFFFYDEGLYLGLNRELLRLINLSPAKDFSEFLSQLYLCFRLALGEGKALWFFLSHLRVFWGGLEEWFFPRLLSAVFGSATFFFVYLFTKRFFSSRRAGLLSVILLALLPSHIFYSRLALQEATSAFCFLLGIYLYISGEKLSRRTFVSALFLVLANFLNYRLIILPVFVLFCELYLKFSGHEKPDWRKYIWHTLSFFVLIFLIGSIDEGQNITVTLTWMIFQSNLAAGQVSLFNFLSYPYYIFRFEGLPFGIVFFANVYLIIRKEWKMAFPFFFVLLGMAIFSLTADKAARYLCIMLPFVAMAAVSLLEYFFSKQNTAGLKKASVILFILLVFSLVFYSVKIARIHSDYEESVVYLQDADHRARLLTMQPWIQKIHFDIDNVNECPKTYEALVEKYAKGFRYLIICPQGYISFTQSKRKFDPPLIDYLNFIQQEFKPIKTFGHFNQTALERFVFEHNENFHNSLRFLKMAKKENLGKLEIYDIKAVVEEINRRLAFKNKRQ